MLTFDYCKLARSIAMASVAAIEPTTEKTMRISPEPLHPLRNWRELWHSEPLSFAGNYRDRHAGQADFCKPQKRTSFQWLGHLFVRDLHR